MSVRGYCHLYKYHPYLLNLPKKWAISNITVVLTKVILQKITYDIYQSCQSYTFTNVMLSNIDTDSNNKLQKEIML